MMSSELIYLVGYFDKMICLKVVRWENLYKESSFLSNLHWEFYRGPVATNKRVKGCRPNVPLCASKKGLRRCDFLANTFSIKADQNRDDEL